MIEFIPWIILALVLAGIYAYKSDEKEYSQIEQINNKEVNSMSTESKNTKKCKHCAEEILAEANTCKHCGKKQGTSIWVWILLTPIVILGLLMVIGSNVSPEKSNSRSAIALCWDNYDSLRKNPTISDGALGLAYDSCQFMVKRFEEKYGYSSTLRKD